MEIKNQSNGLSDFDNQRLNEGLSTLEQLKLAIQLKRETDARKSRAVVTSDDIEQDDAELRKNAEQELSAPEDFERPTPKETPQVSADAELDQLSSQLIQSNLQDIESINQRMQTTFDLIANGYDDVAAVKSLEAAYEEDKKAKEAENERFLQAKRTQLMNAVGFRFGSEGSSSVLEKTISQGEEALEGLKDEHNRLVQETKQALRDDDLEKLDSLRAELRDVKGDLSTQITSQQKLIRERAESSIRMQKTLLEAERISQELTSKATQPSRDAMILSMMQQGVEEPAVLFDYANFTEDGEPVAGYDEDGNPVIAVSFSEVMDVYDAVQKTKTQPNTDIVGSDSTGRWLVTYSDDGQILRKNLITSPRATSSGTGSGTGTSNSGGLSSTVANMRAQGKSEAEIRTYLDLNTKLTNTSINALLEEGGAESDASDPRLMVREFIRGLDEDTYNTYVKNMQHGEVFRGTGPARKEEFEDKLKDRLTSVAPEFRQQVLDGLISSNFIGLGVDIK